MFPFKKKKTEPSPFDFNTPAAATAREPRPWLLRLHGFLILVLCILIALSLASYTPTEMQWDWLKPKNISSAVSETDNNILGIVGTYTAAFFYYLYGAGAWWLVVLGTWVGLRRLIFPKKPWRKQWICLLLLLILACMSFSLQDIFFLTWASTLGIYSAGGVLGSALGPWTLGQWMQPIIPFSVAILAHAIALIYFADSTPLACIKLAWADFKNLWRRWREHSQRKKVWKQASKNGEMHLPLEAEQAKLNIPNTDEQFFYNSPSKTSANAEARANAPVIKSTGRNTHETPAQLVQQQMSIVQDSEPHAPIVQPPPTARTPRPQGRAISATPKPAPAHAAKATPASIQEGYPLPPLDMLTYKPASNEDAAAAQAEMYEVQQRIIDTLAGFNIDVQAGDITRGPSITRYEFYPPLGLRVNKIANLQQDLMLATSSASINILAPIPGKNTVGIEIANVNKTSVYLRELLEDDSFKNGKFRIPVALGKNVYGQTVIGDLAAMPHTLVAGTTGSGKSVCINSMIISMLYKFSPEDLKLILVDPKVVEMQPYRKLPRLACPVITDPGRVIGALRWAVNEMEHRYKLFSKMGVRNFVDYNNRPEGYIPEDEEEANDAFFNNKAPVDYAKIEAMASEIERQADDELYMGEEDQEELDFSREDDIPDKMPYIVIIIDELADLMMIVKDDVENYIARLTQKARAAGIHLVVATQTPRSNVVTGIIKANIPSRIAFKVSSPLDSRIILDTDGAENLLGQGDFLFIPPGGISKMTRAQGAFVSDEEVSAVVRHCARHAKQEFMQSATTELEQCEGGEATATNGGRMGDKSMSAEESELYTRCLNLVVTERKASTSLLQRRFSIGYGRAARMMDMLEERGIISPPQGNNSSREILVERPE